MTLGFPGTYGLSLHAGSCMIVILHAQMIMKSKIKTRILLSP
ncbi:hypothetical protein CIT292_09256 [Citrobacter youngae ATCC 29220]|uniref:Uncharacterized protein n=1 Tax=Citrobacter youngae ATCC 29220 TaxID=500640 RepID=D4BEP4_9ENTR|nr:hypothetical protein CIT292_09256 [Citrobacter youngae ATCC 29220]